MSKVLRKKNIVRMTAVSCLAAFNTTINNISVLRMSISEAVIQGEAIESENESDVEFDAHNKNYKVITQF